MNRTSKLSRYTSLARFARMPQVRKEPRRPALAFVGTEPPRDAEYLARVRELPCCAIGLPKHSCMGPRISHHAGKHAAGVKCSDYEAISLCSLAHTNIHDLNGCFRGFTRERVRAFEDAAIAETQRVLGRTPTV